MQGVTGFWTFLCTKCWLTIYGATIIIIIFCSQYILCLIGIQNPVNPFVPSCPKSCKNVQKTGIFDFFDQFLEKKVKKIDNKIKEKKNYAHKILNQTSKIEKYGHKE